jgi:hypothetical protein
MTARKNKIPILAGAFILAGVFCPLLAGAHATNHALDNLSRSEVGYEYLRQGFLHIIPFGFDHILFVLCIFLLNPNLKSVLWQCTAFTVAHSITLGLAMNGIIDPPTSIVEPVIALSIFFVAAENILTDKLKPARILLVFIFGLIHGMGFAGALGELGLPQKEFATALITFNIGVELGQIAVILLAWFAMGIWFSKKDWYKKRIVVPASAMIAIVAIYWTVTRTFF